jgi:hypothetical protein
MKVMVFVKATQDSETGVMPSEQLLTEMGQYNEELATAGILLAAEGFHPSSKGVRVHFSLTDRTVTQGPFTPAQELVVRQANFARLHWDINAPFFGEHLWFENPSRH